MNREDIIRMANEANVLICDEFEKYGATIPELERFAALVVKATREECAKLAETPVGEYEVIVACGTDPVPQRIPRYLEWQSIAAAIRARKD
jgi:hypothetical protein